MAGASCAAQRVPPDVAGQDQPPGVTAVQPASGPVAASTAPEAVAAARPTPTTPRGPAQRQDPPPPSQLEPLVIAQLEDQVRVPGLDTARMSLLMSEPIHIADLLLLLVRDTQVSIVLDPDIDGTFVGELKDVTLRQALDIALAPHDLEYAVEGGVIRVFPRRTATRFFDVDYVTTRRSATRTLSAPTMPLAATASSVEVTRTDQEHFFEQVADGVGALLSPRGRMHLDRKAALVQVTDYPDRLAHVEQYLDRVLRRVLRQVHLQARLIEVELDGASAGIDWPAAVVAAGGQHRSQARSSVAPVGTLADFDRLIEALATQGRVTVLSSPSVVTLNNEPTVLSVRTTDARSGTGLSLTVTPQVGAEGMITLSVSPSVVSTVDLGATAEVPELNVRELDTVARVRDGETLVLTGLLREVASRRPAAPLRGPPRPDGRSQRTDLLILVTPTVLTSS